MKTTDIKTSWVKSLNTQPTGLLTKWQCVVKWLRQCASFHGGIWIAGLLVSLSPLSHANLLEKEILKRLDLEKDNLSYQGVEDWFFITEELNYLVSGPFWGPYAENVSKASPLEDADPLPAILDFQRQLHSNDIELILVPIPPKILVYPDKFTDAISFDPTSRWDPHLQTFYNQLRKQGLIVLDVLSTFQEERQQQEKPLYCRQDSHYSGYGSVVVAEMIAKEIRKRFWHTTPTQTSYKTKWKTMDITGDLVLGDRTTESIPLRFVGTGEEQISLKMDRKSPVLLLGDSHVLVFSVGNDMYAKGAGLADQLSYALGYPIDLLGVRGSGSTPARLNLYRRAKRDSTYWTHKKTVVWCFAAREFTESSSGWRRLPIKPE